MRYEVRGAKLQGYPSDHCRSHRRVTAITQVGQAIGSRIDSKECIVCLFTQKAYQCQAKSQRSSSTFTAPITQRRAKQDKQWSGRPFQQTIQQLSTCPSTWTSILKEIPLFSPRYIIREQVITMLASHHRIGVFVKWQAK